MAFRIARPFGQRILDQRFNRQPLDPAQKLRLATNNYRVNGGGGYTMYKGAPELSLSSREIRDMIIEWIEQLAAYSASQLNDKTLRSR